ncbi:uracil-DNA glycosylase family protein [Mesorhizobium sp. DCY119]|jgi:uracil-DNA glycosylase|uniref:uracil-DNA glycosylase family protein n=1 Tax=Mesorhizobium sp. DCY119 TaxID=2108445 RepID=UPI000E6B7642|nr:uracil-DNA glycosylase family protein [Mesorhizobium sp. DCY119]RJG44936.1 uracil-DNA glycosylase family protein [Mesorhizobium sp. DCY119]
MPAELDRLVAEIRACRICVEQPLARPLPHEPRPVVVASTSARVLIAGQAPGTKVHASGMPFDDRSGDRLRDWLGVTREQFYNARNFAIVPMGFCFPGQDAKGGDLPPRRECAPAWRQRLIDLMPQVDLVLAIGLYAQSWHLGAARKASLNETVRDWRAIHDAPTMPRVIPLPHPSWRNTGWLKQNPWFEMELLPVLKSEIRHRIS